METNRLDVLPLNLKRRKAMKLQKRITFSIIICLVSGISQADHLPIGMNVLAKCHSFYSKGEIKRLHKEKYVIDFDKNSRPVLCTPFAWDSEFLVPYKPVPEYSGQLNTDEGVFGGSKEQAFKRGDKLKIEFEATPRGAMFSSNYSVTVTIKEINSNGAAQMDIIAGESEAKQLFERWVGTNYVMLDFSEKMSAEKLTIKGAEKL